MKDKYLILLSFLFLPTAVYAVGGPGVTLADVADRVLEPAVMIAQMAYAICYVVGTGMLVASLLRYKEYRRNPVHVRLSQPLMVFMFGLALILLPILAQMSTSSAPLR